MGKRSQCSVENGEYGQGRLHPGNDAFVTRRRLLWNTLLLLFCLGDGRDEYHLTSIWLQFRTERPRICQRQRPITYLLLDRTRSLIDLKTKQRTKEEEEEEEEKEERFNVENNHCNCISKYVFCVVAVVSSLEISLFLWRQFLLVNLVVACSKKQFYYYNYHHLNQLLQSRGKLMMMLRVVCVCTFLS